MYYDKIMYAVSNMTDEEQKGLAEILDLYKLCHGDEKGLLMYSLRSFLTDRFFITFVDARSNN